MAATRNQMKAAFTSARAAGDRARYYATKESKEMFNEIIDILVEAGILQYDKDGDYEYDTDENYGRFSITKTNKENK